MSDRRTRKEISNFYGSFCDEERKLKLNVRHYAIFKHLRKAGLKRNHSVLEIGCGFGTVTSLLSRYLVKGTVVGTDISVERIETCRRNFASRKNVRFVLTDMKDFDSKEKFDVILLPDVLEHIPVEDHEQLFGLINHSLTEAGFVVIHIPHPRAIEYLRKTSPELLQIIDQSVHSDELLRCAYSNGLELVSMSSYSLTRLPEDYQLIIFRKANQYARLDPISGNEIRIKKWLAKIYFWSKLIFG